MTRPAPEVILALHPNRRGFGWIAFQGPFSPCDWGTASISRDLHAQSLRRVETLIERLGPAMLVLEEIPGTTRRRAARFVQGVTLLASERGIELAVYARTNVAACFRTVGAASRQDIAEAVGRILPALAPLTPRPRRAWQKEAHHMSLFSAAALGLTHFQLGAASFLDRLA